MENPEANQLPEADALPDGFVESSAEPQAPPTPTVEQEKPLCDYKEDSYSELDHSDKLSETSQGREEKTQKLRTFPVPLSETDCFEAPKGLGEVSDKGCMEQSEGTPVSPDSANVSEASVGVSGCSEETPEAKRKNVKRAFKSDKEFLEFTLKYQQVLAERDGGKLD
uniref:Uncharacterized protein n=1 Tax=Fagus sylvatica TaxID=28930 RepID=A0A2N9EG12_FAGSY